MDTVLVILTLAASLQACLGYTIGVAKESGFELTDWETYKMIHAKVYPSPEEESYRKDIFHRNLKHIYLHNKQFQAKNRTFSLSLNEFADMPIEELKKTRNGYKMRTNLTVGMDLFRATTYLSPSFVVLPKSVDWRDKGYVTPVKNQGSCGSCWAFSTTGSLEGQHFKKQGKLVSLSEQNLVDCSGKFGNDGCNGGLMDNAFKYIKKNHGIDDEESYPYEAVQGDCRFKKQDIGADDTGFVDLPTGDEEKLKEAVATVGPISVAIDASHMSFQFYRSGVYNEPRCSSTQLDHGVLVVGYGTEDGKDYWLVKNSWAETWGEKGYIKMTRNQENMCGVATDASYPLV